MRDKAKRVLLGNRADRFKGGFCGHLYSYLWTQDCFSDRELDATLRGKEGKRGETEDATLTDGYKDTP